MHYSFLSYSAKELLKIYQEYFEPEVAKKPNGITPAGIYIRKKVISVYGIIKKKISSNHTNSIYILEFLFTLKFFLLENQFFLNLAGGRGGWNRGRGRGGGHHARGGGAARNAVVPVRVVPDSNAIEKLKTIEDHSDKQWTECMLSNLMHCNQIGKKQICWKI